MPGSFLEGYSVFKGAYHAIPGGPESPRIIFFNKRRFAEVGAPLPSTLEAQGRWTWEAYAETATRLSQGAPPARSYGTRDYLLSLDHYSWIFSGGGTTLSEDFKRCVMDRPETVAVLQLQADLLHKHRVAPVPGDALGAGDPFVSGRVGMFASGVWAVLAVPQPPRGRLRPGAPPQRAEGAARRTIVKHNVLVVPAGVNGPPAAAAWELIKYLVGPENRKVVIDSGQSLNNLKELESYFLERTPLRDAKVFLEASARREAVPLPVFPKWDAFEQIVNEELKVRQGQAGVPAAVGLITPRVNDLLRG